MNNEHQDIQEFIQKLQIAIIIIEGSKLVVESYVKIGSRIKIIDAVLLVNSKVLAVFEFKKEINSISSQEIISLAEDLPVECRFIVFGNGRSFKIIDTITSKIKHSKNVEELLKILFQERKVNSDWKIKLRIREEIVKTYNSFKRELATVQQIGNKKVDNERIETIQNAMSLLKSDDFLENLQYDIDGQYYHFVEDIRDINSLENRFFKYLVHDVPVGSRIHRYTTLDTSFRTIEGKKLRLSGIVGMNDISEVGYIDTYLDSRFVPMGDDILIDSVNRKFIMCSSILEDELMQWRLYGDDCKGGCLVFSVTNNNELPGLLLRKISYGIEVNGSNYHPELELLNRIRRRLKRNLHIDFRFRTIEIWKHFFKSFEYSPENEVRLLLIGNQYDEIKGEKFLTGVGTNIDVSWNLTSSHQILAPYIFLDIDDNRLRCKLEGIVLGAKCPEIGVNLKQFKYLSRKRNLLVEVRPSKIKNYR